MVHFRDILDREDKKNKHDQGSDGVMHIIHTFPRLHTCFFVFLFLLSFVRWLTVYFCTTVTELDVLSVYDFSLSLTAKLHWKPLSVKIFFLAKSKLFHLFTVFLRSSVMLKSCMYIFRTQSNIYYYSPLLSGTLSDSKHAHATREDSHPAVLFQHSGTPSIISVGSPGLKHLPPKSKYWQGHCCDESTQDLTYFRNILTYILLRKI